MNILASTERNNQEDQKTKPVNSDVSEMESKIFYKTGSMVNKQKVTDPKIKLIETPRAKRRQNLLLEKIKDLKVIEGKLGLLGNCFRHKSLVFFGKGKVLLDFM